MNWDYKEFRHLCKKNNLPDSTMFQKSLFWKRARAVYHSDNAKDTWKKLWNQNKPINIFGRDWEIRQLAIEAEVEACAQVLNSMPEMMAHIINTSLFRGLKPSKALPDENVHILCIKDKILQLPNNPNNIKKEIEDFVFSGEFSYIRAFINTIKHHRLLDTNWFINAKPDDLKKEIKFSSFSHKGWVYNEKDYTYIIDDCVKDFLKRIVDIGISINNYLK